MHHHNESLGEAYPARIRILTPQFVAVNTEASGADLINSNHTLPDGTEHMVLVHHNASLDGNSTHSLGVFDLEFSNHFTYYDVAHFNFTMSIDPMNKRLIGSGLINSSIVLSPLCKVNPFHTIPAAPVEWITCGSPTYVQFAADSPGMLGTIP